MRNLLPRLGLRARLMCVAILPVLPMVGLLLESGLQHRQSARAAADKETLGLARVAAADQQKLIDATRQLLITLARLPVVRDGGGQERSDFLAELLTQHTSYTNLGVAGVDGNVVATAVPKTGPINIADRDYFQDSLRSGGFTVGRLILDHITGDATVHMAYPIRDSMGRVKAIVFAALDLAWLNQLVAAAELPAGSVLTVVDRHGTILSRFPNPEEWIGKSVTETPQFAPALAEQREGTTVAPGIDGVPRLYGFTPVSKIDGVAPAYVLVGIPVATVYADAERQLRRSFGWLGVAAGLAAATAWIVGGLFILRPVKSLSDATERVAGGDFTARTKLARGGGELGQLGQAFNDMAATLERRDLERKRFEAARALLAGIVESSDDAIVSMTLAGIVTSWNPGAEAVFGYTASEMTGKSVAALTPPDSNGEDLELLARIRRGERVQHYETVRQRNDARRIQVSLTLSPLRDEAGRIIGAATIARDITSLKQAAEERARLESQLFQSQKIQALGTLAGGIAHDFNNILALIRGNAALALSDLPTDHAAHTSLVEIDKASRRAADLVRRILTFGRREELHRQTLELPPVVGEAAQLLRATLPARIHIHVHAGPDLPPIAAEPTLVHQVVMNLGANAAHAIGERGGEIEIRLEAVAVDDALAASVADLRRGEYVRLTVADNGCGMDEATLGRIFEPFFTTKPLGQGTGLGLSVVHGILHSHDGAVSVESDPGQGTTVALYFPVAASKVATVPKPTAKLRCGDGHHILYLDDEGGLVFLLARYGERLGYHVTGHTDARQALDDFHRRPDAFDIVVTDLSMPGISGMEFAREVLDARPDMPVILTTGSIRPEDVAAAEQLGVRSVMAKPNTVQALAEALHEALEGKRGGDLMQQRGAESNASTPSPIA
jgi:PAS domain S-box-containing protein